MKRIFSGLRLKVFVYMALFAAGLLVLLYVLQITLLPVYYQNQVFQTVKATNNQVTTLMKDHENDNIRFGEIYDSMSTVASQNNLCLYVFGDDNRIKLEINAMGSTCYLDYLITPSVESKLEPIPIIQQYVDMADSSESENYNYYFTAQPNVLMSLQLFHGQRVTIDDSHYYIFINTPYELVDSTVATLQDQFMFVSLIVFMLSMVVAFVISRQLSKPLVEMSHEANKLGQGDLNVHFPSGGYYEIDTLAETLNYATKEIQKTDNLRSDLLANISHDIRTPLTMISAYAQMIQDISKDDPIKRDEHLQIIINEVEDLNALLADMMTLSQVQSNTTRLNFTHFDLVALTKGIINTYRKSPAYKDINIVFEGVDKALINADEIKTRQIIQNYLTNAYKHVGDDKSIYIKIMIIDETGFVRLEVKDNGSGIQQEELDLIWDRYYKGNKNYQRAREGTGLGLAITKAICERMGCPYGVISTLGEGSLFYVEFEMAPQSLFTRES